MVAQPLMPHLGDRERIRYPTVQHDHTETAANPSYTRPASRTYSNIQRLNRRTRNCNTAMQ